MARRTILPHVQNRPAGSPDIPPAKRRRRSAPNHCHDRPRHFPLPVSKNRNNHQKTHPHPTTSTRSHHKPTRKPTNHSSTKNQPPNPENPGQTGSLNLCNSDVTIRLTMRVCLTGFMLSSRAYRRLGHILNWMLQLR